MEYVWKAEIIAHDDDSNTGYELLAVRVDKEFVKEIGFFELQMSSEHIEHPTYTLSNRFIIPEKHTAMIISNVFYTLLERYGVQYQPPHHFVELDNDFFLCDLTDQETIKLFDSVYALMSRWVATNINACSDLIPEEYLQMRSYWQMWNKVVPVPEDVEAGFKVLSAEDPAY